MMAAQPASPSSGSRPRLGAERACVATVPCRCSVRRASSSSGADGGFFRPMRMRASAQVAGVGVGGGLPGSARDTARRLPAAAGDPASCGACARICAR